MKGRLKEFMDDIGWLLVGALVGLTVFALVVFGLCYLGCCYEVSVINERMGTDFTGWELFMAGDILKKKIIGEKRELGGEIVIKKAEGGE